MAIDADGKPVVVWGEVSGGFKAARKAGGWEVVTISDALSPSSRCLAVADGLGNVHAVWDSRGGVYTAKPEIYYACIRWRE